MLNRIGAYMASEYARTTALMTTSTKPENREMNPAKNAFVLMQRRFRAQTLYEDRLIVPLYWQFSLFGQPKDI